MASLLTWQPALQISLPLAVPGLYFLAALGLLLRRESARRALLDKATLLAGLCALAAAASLLLPGATAVRFTVLAPQVASPLWPLSVASDPLSSVVLLLVSFLGWVIVRYSQPYLAGEPGLRRYYGWLLATLASVSLLVLSNHLLLLLAAWIAVSLSLHRLLTFYADRPAAQLAARKKFVVSRLAELALAAAIALIGSELHTLQIDQVLTQISRLSTVPVTLQIAAVLVVLSVCLKSAQLPFHGWLIQVMEAPTPVSALLHAGVVNLGGYVLLRLGGLIGSSPTAQGLLVLVGGLSAVLASLVMLTRVSIKVALAWSTCAQLGFMLLECGLGAYDLALLHLLAHSLYKAHAFLSAGSTVENWRTERKWPKLAPPSLSSWLGYGAVSLGVVHAGGILTGSLPLPTTPGGVLRGLLGLALTPLFVLAGRGGPVASLALALGVAGLASVPHLLARLLGLGSASFLPHHGPPAGTLAFAALCFVFLFALQGTLLSAPQGTWSRRLYPWFFGGLFLDELFTRLMLKWRRQQPAGAGSASLPRHPLSALPSAPEGPPARAAIDHAVRWAGQRIAPTWPLDRFIAVNPYHGLGDRPIQTAAAELQLLCGAQLLMPRAFYRRAWQSGQLRREHLAAGLEDHHSTLTVEGLIACLQATPATLPRLRLVCDLVAMRGDPAQRESLPPWPDYVTHQISQFCAAWFDGGQADWPIPRGPSMYATWKTLAAADRGPVLRMGLPDFRARVAMLPATAQDLLAFVTAELRIPAAACPAYFAALLLRINGWAAWCAYQRFEARKLGGDDDQIVQLLAIRLAWEWLLARCAELTESEQLLFHTQWGQYNTLLADTRAAQEPDWLLQQAMEQAYQDTLCHTLRSGETQRAESSDDDDALDVQAVFCIDVRSEPFRRALEACSGRIRTSGFAGFFGLPIDYTALGCEHAEPRLPGLLSPRLHARESCDRPTQTQHLQRQHQRRAQKGRAARALRRLASSAFAFVETFGMLYALKLLARSLRRTDLRESPLAGPRAAEHQADLPRPSLPDTADLAPMLAGILGAMGRTSDFARLVLLCGHGSTSQNNPHAAALQCGACGGQSGEVNARLLAQLLNTDTLRDALRQHGIDIPGTTWFVAGLHDTTSDDVRLFDLDRVPTMHQALIATLQGWLAQAAASNRQARAATLDPELALLDRSAQRHAFVQRGSDWAQVRPEWGLADNACLIVAPRERTRSISLGGRAFLHDYDFRKDASLRTLELILTAPMVVTHWINLQYYASTVDPLRYGSGNKVLHNIVGGHLGVFEGNGGDLRIGLPQQCLHDGTGTRHTPLRLSVFIEAPRDAIETVLARQPQIADLVRNEWLRLFQINAADGRITRFVSDAQGGITTAQRATSQPRAAAA